MLSEYSQITANAKAAKYIILFYHSILNIKIELDMILNKQYLTHIKAFNRCRYPIRRHVSRGGATVLKVVGKKLCERSEPNFFLCTHHF